MHIIGLINLATLDYMPIDPEYDGMETINRPATDREQAEAEAKRRAGKAAWIEDYAEQYQRVLASHPNLDGSGYYRGKSKSKGKAHGKQEKPVKGWRSRRSWRPAGSSFGIFEGQGTGPYGGPDAE